MLALSTLSIEPRNVQVFTAHDPVLQRGTSPVEERRVLEEERRERLFSGDLWGLIK